MAKAIAAKPQLVQISTAYGSQKEGSAVLPRNKYTAIRDDKPKSKDEATRPEFKVCKYATEAIITEGSDVGTIQKVCVNPDCPVHHPKKATSAGTNDAQWKAEQEKRRKEEAIANATGCAFCPQSARQFQCDSPSATSCLLPNVSRICSTKTALRFWRGNMASRRRKKQTQSASYLQLSSAVPTRAR